MPRPVPKSGSEIAQIVRDMMKRARETSGEDLTERILVRRQGALGPGADVHLHGVPPGKFSVFVSLRQGGGKIFNHYLREGVLELKDDPSLALIEFQGVAGEGREEGAESLLIRGGFLEQAPNSLTFVWNRT